MKTSSNSTTINNDFIKKLQKERTDYKYASQVRTMAKSLIQLSVGIYTEPERFVYELIQNAVDSFVDTDNEVLEILIEVCEGKFVFRHNGKPFDENDVVGICDVGNGTKAKDNKKIGYKGIGFKSVFMPSVNRVGITSGRFCFEFNKQKACELIPDFPKEEKPLTPDDIPWQVIPICTQNLPEGNDDTYNVTTIVYTRDALKIGEKIERLFSDLQFLLFLRSNNVKICFKRDNRIVFSVGKEQTNCLDGGMPLVTLKKDNQLHSSWMLFTRDVDVPTEIKDALEQDFNTPDKLKGAEKVEISFAVQISEDKVVPLKNTTVFTFLPTSYHGLRQPFLINSNFITDAGRQQLHQESEWNKLIFRKIPELYLEFVSLFSHKYKNYADVLPTLYPDSDTLVGEYRSSLNGALKNIAFVPNRNGNNLLKLEDVLIDKTGITNDILPSNKILECFNRFKSAKFTNDSFVDNEQLVAYANHLVTVLDSDDLIRLIGDSDIISGISIQDDIKLLYFLHDYFEPLSNNEYKDILANTKFLYDNDKLLKQSRELFFPGDYHEQDEEMSNVAILNSEIYEDIRNNDEIINWLKSIGVRDLSNLSFVNYILSNPSYVTTENALSVGRFLFNVWKRENFLETLSNADNIGNLCFLSKDGKLQPIRNLYLGTLYHPDDDLESVCKKTEMFISDEYPLSNVDDWSYFLKKCGAIFKIGLLQKDISVKDIDFDFIKQAANSFSEYKHCYTNYWGYKNPIIDIHVLVSYFTFIDYNKPNITLDKFILSKVLSTDMNYWNITDNIYGKVSYWGTKIEMPLNDFTTNEHSTKYKSFFEYVIANKQTFPTTLGTSEISSKVFINNSSILELGDKYLPILDLDTNVHDSWKAIIPFKQYLTITDLLEILDKISYNNEDSREIIKDRVTKIYREIIDRGEQCSSIIKDWAQTHKILSHSGDFLPASQMTYVAIDGFKNGFNKVFCDGIGQVNHEKLMDLLKTFGVKVIEHFSIKIPNDTIINSEIKERLSAIAPLIACLKDEEFGKALVKTRTAIDEISFYNVNQIELTYGEDNDVIKKTVYADDSSIYYVGEWKKLRVLNSLMEPLAKLLHIRQSNAKMLEVLLTSDIDECIDYLAEYGIQVPENAIQSVKATAIRCLEDEAIMGGGMNGGETPTLQQIAENEEAKHKVLNKLANEGFDTSRADAKYSVIHGVFRDGVQYPLVVKSCKNQEHKIWIKPDEWAQLFRPNSMLWLHFGGGVVAPIKAYELFTYQDKLTLSFDTVNLMMDDRINKIMEVLRYFNKVHLELATINPDSRRSDNYEEYSFWDNNPENNSLESASID